jgi:hypothetical protein
MPLAAGLKSLAHVIFTENTWMVITFTIDDDLYTEARGFADPGLSENELIELALKTFIRIQAGKRLIALGGTMPDLDDLPHCR